MHVMQAVVMARICTKQAQIVVYGSLRTKMCLWMNTPGLRYCPLWDYLIITSTEDVLAIHGENDTKCPGYMLEASNGSSVWELPELDMIITRCRCDECASRIKSNGIDYTSMDCPGITNLLLGCCIPFTYGRIDFIPSCEKACAIGCPCEWEVWRYVSLEWCNMFPHAWIMNLDMVFCCNGKFSRWQIPTSPYCHIHHQYTLPAPQFIHVFDSCLQSLYNVSHCIQSIS